MGNKKILVMLVYGEYYGQVYEVYTVLTRNYAPPPPFCWLGLATSMGGLIIIISLVYTPPFLDTVVCDKCNSIIM